MKYEEIEKAASEYYWLRDIANKYRRMIACMEREQEYFRLCSWEYLARSDVQKFTLNSHRSIPVKYLIEGLREALSGIEEEMKHFKSVLAEFNIEVSEENKLSAFRRALQEQRKSIISRWIYMLKNLLMPKGNKTKEL